MLKQRTHVEKRAQWGFHRELDLRKKHSSLHNGCALLVLFIRCIRPSLAKQFYYFFQVTFRATLQVTMRITASLSLSVALAQMLHLTLAIPTMQSSTSSLVPRSPMCFNAPGTRAGT